MEPVFSEWRAFSLEAIDAHAPTGAAAVQVRRVADLVQYPIGKSAMLFYFFAATDAGAALKRLFADEIATPGVRGEGPTWFRTLAHPNAEAHLVQLYEDFRKRFGAVPLWNQEQSDT